MATALDRWLAARRKGLGGSDIAAVAGLSSYRTPLDVYNEKLGLVAPEPASAPMRRGRDLEGVILRDYRAKHPERRLTKWPRSKLLVHPRHYWAMGTPDATAVEPASGRSFVVEAKSLGERTFIAAREQGLPSEYVAQLQWYMGLGGFSHGSFALHSVVHWETLVFDVDFDPALFDALIQRGREFWFNHIAERVPPAVDQTVEPIPITPVSGEATPVPDSPEWQEALRLYRETDATLRAAEQNYRLAKERIMGLVGGHGIWAGIGATVRWLVSPGRKTLDKARLAALEPVPRHWIRKAILERGLTDPDTVDELLDDCKLDLAEIEKRGAPFEECRIYLRSTPWRAEEAG